MLIHPQFDPVIFSLGPVSLRWYGAMYAIGFFMFWLLGHRRLRARPELGISAKDLDDLLFYGVIGLVLGARLGEVLFYNPGYYFAHPIEILKINKGGMSFHGGFLGSLLVLTIWVWVKKIPWLAAADFVVPLTPLGLFFGRIGNFINGELWGRVADAALPWAMVFPQVDALPRHPSQLYEALLEGLLLFIILWAYSARPRPRGTVAALFLIGYGSFRFICEFFRVPDPGIFGKGDVLSMGQWLSLPMIVVGVLMMLLCLKRAATAVNRS